MSHLFEIGVVLDTISSETRTKNIKQKDLNKIRIRVRIKVSIEMAKALSPLVLSLCNILGSK